MGHCLQRPARRLDPLQVAPDQARISLTGDRHDRFVAMITNVLAVEAVVDLTEAEYWNVSHGLLPDACTEHTVDMNPWYFAKLRRRGTALKRFPGCVKTP